MGSMNRKVWKKNVIGIFVLVIVIAAWTIGCQKKSVTVAPIIPKPLSYEQGSGSFKLTEKTSIYVQGNRASETKEIYEIGELLQSQMRDSTGFTFEIVESDQVPEGSIYLTTRGDGSSQNEEAYTLDVTDKGVVIGAYKPEGLARGIQTLRQLLPADIEKDELVTEVPWQIQATSIKDEPEYGYRGLMIDVARHFVSKEELMRQIDLAAAYKINRVHLHLSDDQGWRLEIKKWPELTNSGASTAVGGGPGGYYTQEDFKEIVAYAGERYIEIIPEFDMPGHTQAALSSYGFLSPDGKKQSICTGIEVGFSTFMCRDEKTYEWIKDVIMEVAAISPSPYLHIGGDEAHNTTKEDYDYFIGRICKIVEACGKTPIGWDPCDTSSEGSSNLILQNWNGDNQAARVKGLKIILSPAEKAYLDMKYDNESPYGLDWAGCTSVKDAYKWDPTQYAPKELVLGVEAPLWTETIGDSKAMDYMIYPRLLGHAEIGWTPKEGRSWGDYKKRLAEHKVRMDYQGIQYAPID